MKKLLVPLLVLVVILPAVALAPRAVLASSPVVLTSSGTLTVRSAPPSGGGSGGGSSGGGGGGDYTPIVNLVDSQDRLIQEVIALSADQKASLKMPKGTVCKNRVGGRISSILVRPLSEAEQRPELPAYSLPVGKYYVLGPSGATFNPAITLTFKYDPGQVIEGAAESNLVIFRWDSTAEQWEALESRVDAISNTVSADIDRFSFYALMTRSRPAAFTVSDLQISPQEVIAGRPVTVSIRVANNGDLAGNYEARLFVDGAGIDSKLVNVPAHASQTVSFYPSLAAGTRNIEIGDLSAAVAVLPAETAAPGMAAAAFALSDLAITPATVEAGESVVVSFRVSNTGDLAGNYEARLFVDGDPAGTRQVTLIGRVDQTVSFSVTAVAPGIRSVTVGDLSGTFEVIPAPSAGDGAAPAAFTFSEMTVVPAEVEAGEPVAISALVTNNTGDTTSTVVELKINGITVSSQKVTLQADSGQRVTFNVARDAAGFYIARVGDSTASFQVRSGGAAVSWSLVLIIIFVVAAIGAALRFLVFSRKPG